MFKKKREALEIKEFAIFIFHADGDAIYMGVCGAVTQNLVRRRTIADFFFIRTAFHVKFG